jgi:purine-nucleoside phosphorylase
MVALASDDFLRAEEAAQFILERTPLRPRVGVVLGSGLGAIADGVTDATPIPYEEIPHFPKTTAEGHAGVLVLGKINDVSVAALMGRAHLYEGYSAVQVVLPVRTLGRMGVRAIVLTNAAGGINSEYSRGALVVLRDHINLQGHNPLIGPNDERLGLRHPDLTDAYNSQFRQFVHEESERLGGTIFEGVYAAVLGPNFETPAEIRFLRSIGSDLVGMSTVPEVTAARHMGMEVLAISCVTNMAAGMTGEKITAEEVQETGMRLSGEFLALLRATLPRIDGYLDSYPNSIDTRRWSCNSER